MGVYIAERSSSTLQFALLVTLLAVLFHPSSISLSSPVSSETSWVFELWLSGRCRRNGPRDSVLSLWHSYLHVSLVLLFYFLYFKDECWLGIFLLVI